MTAEPSSAGITRCAVLGSPIAHSLSPALHRAAYAHLGLDWDYGRYEMVAADLAAFVASCGPEWRGLSLTMPLKEAALALGEVDQVARLTSAGNTLIFEPDGSRIYNTDVGGLVNALAAGGVRSPANGVILGAGATARSSLVSLARLGAAAVRVVARTPAKAAPLVPLGASLGVTVIVRRWEEPAVASDLLVSTAAAGAADARAQEWAEASAAVFDVVYHPWPTPLAQAAADRGRVVINGLDLLVHQALLQIQLMTGSSVPAAVLYAAGRAALAVV